MSDLPDIENLRLPDCVTMGVASGPRRQVPRHAKGKRFWMGPIPWDWLAAAGCTPGQGLHVALVLWLEAGLRKSAAVSLSHARLRELGVSRYAATRGLNALEAAGLVVVERRPGCSPRVIILPASASSPATG